MSIFFYFLMLIFQHVFFYGFFMQSRSGLVIITAKNTPQKYIQKWYLKKFFRPNKLFSKFSITALFVVLITAPARLIIIMVTLVKTILDFKNWFLMSYKIVTRYVNMQSLGTIHVFFPELKREIELSKIGMYLNVEV